MQQFTNKNNETIKWHHSYNFIAELVNKSFQSGIFPDIFKIAKVIPIFKSELRVLCNNYRPISLLSNISKLIWKLIYKRLYSFLEQQNRFYRPDIFGQNHHLDREKFLMPQQWPLSIKVPEMGWDWAERVLHHGCFKSCL